MPESNFSRARARVRARARTLIQAFAHSTLDPLPSVVCLEAKLLSGTGTHTGTGTGKVSVRVRDFLRCYI